MKAKMWVMVVDATDSGNFENNETKKQETEFVFNLNKVVGLYKQENDLMGIILDSADVPLVYDEYVYNVIEEHLENKEKESM